MAITTLGVMPDDAIELPAAGSEETTRGATPRRRPEL
jgi:hypothetical protein